MDRQHVTANQSRASLECQMKCPLWKPLFWTPSCRCTPRPYKLECVSNTRQLAKLVCTRQCNHLWPAPPALDTAQPAGSVNRSNAGCCSCLWGFLTCLDDDHVTCGSRVAADPSKLAGDLVYSGRSLITPTFFFIPLFGSTQNNCSTAVNCPPSAAVTVQPPTECMIFGFFLLNWGAPWVQSLFGTIKHLFGPKYS